MRAPEPILFTLLLVLLAPVAHAAPSPPPPAAESEADGAARLRQQGNEAMLGMRYSDALALYKQALAANPREVGLHYSIARALQFLGDYPEALASLERFEKEASPEARAKVGSLDALFAQIRPRVSTLRLTSNVDGARVVVGDKVVGTTPLAPLRLPAGATTLSVELDGYFPAKRDVTLPGQGALSLVLELYKKSTSSLLVVRTEPMGAVVLLDGRSLGTSNPTVEVSVQAGAHDVTVHKEGYVDARVPLVLDVGARREVAIPLERPVPVTSRWWFWTGAGALIAGGLVAGIALSTERPASRGSLTPGQIAAP
jgi:hypothetical protein